MMNAFLLLTDPWLDKIASAQYLISGISFLYKHLAGLSIFNGSNYLALNSRYLLRSMSSGFGYFWNSELDTEEVVFSAETESAGGILNPAALIPQSDKVKICVYNSVDQGLLQLVHDIQYINEIKNAYVRGHQKLPGTDIVVSERLFTLALLAASAGCRAVDRVMQKRLRAAFCAVWPPGNKAFRNQAETPSIFNNAAIAAKYAQRFYDANSILIIDFGPEPSMATKEIFSDDPSVFTLSFYEDDASHHESIRKQKDESAGYSFVPLPQATPPEVVLKCIDEELSLIVDRLKPQLLIISAGFRSHKDNPQSKLKIDENVFGLITELILSKVSPFSGEKTVSILEGGYDPESLKRSIIAHCEALAYDSSAGAIHERPPSRFQLANRAVEPPPE